MRLLGIDYGSKKIGVAMGDTETRIASPWTIIENNGHGEVIKQIKFICEREGVERVVLGIPKMLRDTSGENEQIRSIRRFADDLRKENIPVDEADEMMTSVQAQYYLHQTGSKAQDDDVAASIMLQSHLDKLTTNN
ncbi:MAG: Holliday junction resolvase RuvX [Patescibacteria group bacterium]|nr:Holliday junction resolvase RuvX [Patescibacteria group bacterium]